MNSNLKKCIVLDFDGTIADYTHREQLRNTDWDSYIRESKNDVPSEPIIEIINRFKNDYTIVILSARGERCRKETNEWLDKFNVYRDVLELKPDDMTIDDCDAKKILIEEVRQKYGEILFCIDDRPSCIKSFRDLGIYALQCGYGY